VPSWRTPKDDNNNNQEGGQNEGGQENATTAVPESFKGTASLADFKDVESLGEAYVSLKQYQGSSIRIPGEEAGDDQRSEFYGKLAEVDGVMLRPDFADAEQSTEFYRSLGAPEKADGYEYVPSEELKDFKVDDGRVAMFKELALKQGLSKSQFSNIMSSIVSADAAGAAKAAEDRTAEIQGLKTDWGDAYDQNMKTALSVAKATGAPEAMIEAIQAGNTGKELNKWLYALATKFEGEGKNLMDNQERREHFTPDEIRGQISDIMGNPKHPYFDSGHPDHKRALMKMVDLQRRVA